MTSVADLFAAFVPRDRLRALSGGPPVLDRGEGSVLVADVSGFTALTDALARTRGPREGAEELSVLLDRVFGALVDATDAFDGSVIWFAGDAITCCFDGDDGTRAVACGQRMQAAMGAALVPATVIGALSVKVAIAAGQVRRFQVGDPAIQYLEVVAGPAVEQVAAVERHARGGEIVVDAATADRLGERLPVVSWRDGGRCAVVGAARPDLQEGHLHAGSWREGGLPAKIADVAARPWVLPAVRDRLRAGGDAFLAEIRPLVAMFVELADVDLAADDAGARLDGDVRLAQEVLARYGGSLFGVFVDAKGVHLCAGFGAPVAHDDLDARAAAAALAMRDAFAARGVRIGIGISRGHAYCGSFGGATRRTYSPVGSHVNWAARFMQFAGADRIVVGQRVADALAARFALDDLGPTRVKGSSVPLPVHALRGALTDPAPSPGPVAALVGRVTERAALGERLRALRAGRGGTVIVEGEPGIGKSRLLADLRDAATEASVRTLIARGDAIARAVPYHAWRPAFDVLAGPEQAGLRAVLERLDGFDDPVRLLPLLAPVLPGEVADTAATAGLTGQVRAERTRELLDALLRAAAAEGPLLVLVEDAHWLDSASWALVHRLVATPAALLLVLAMRPPADPAPAEVATVAASAERIVLGPLDDADVLALASTTVAASALPAPVAALVGRNAGGNPFFVEQLVRSLHEDGVITVSAGACEIAPDAPDLRTVSYPDTVEGVVMSRIDQLDPEQELALKIASVWGETFEPAELRAVHPVPAHLPRLAADLDALARRDLTRRTGTAYTFRHAITREVAYRRMLGSQRAALHRSIGQWCAARPGTASQPLLAHHWYHAAKDGHGGRDTAHTAVDHLCRAADEVIAADAHAEAPEHFQRALDLLLRDPEGTERDRREMHIRTRLAWTLVARRGYGDADVVAAYRRADELSTRVGESTDLTLILYGLFSFHAFRAEYPQAEQVARRLVTLGEHLDDAGARSVGHQSAGIAGLLGGDVAAACGHLHRSRELADRLGGTVFPGFPTLELRTYTGAWIALAEHLLGRPDAALAAYTDALAITAEQPYTRAFVLAFGGLHQLRGDVPRARADADELDALAGRYSFALFGALALVYRGWTLAMAGDPSGVAMIEDGLIMPRMAKADSTLPRFLAMLAQARLAAGRPADAAAAAAEGLAMVTAAEAGSWEAELLRVQADALAAGGSAEDVVAERLARALAVAKAGGLPWWERQVLATAQRLTIASRSEFALLDQPKP